MKHFIDISDFTATKLDSIIKLAKQIKQNPKKFSNKCNNKTLGMIFQKSLQEQELVSVLDLAKWEVIV